MLRICGEEELIHREAYLEADLELGEEVDLKQLRYRSAYYFGLERAKAYLSRGPRTRKQLRDYLIDRGFSLPSEEILNCLTQYGFLNDLDYAQAYYEAQREKKGSMAIRHLLMQKGVSAEVLDQILMEEDPETAARILAKKYDDWENLSYEEEAKRKKFLLGRGFSYETINKSIILVKNWNK